MIEDLFAYNKSALDIPEVQDLLNRCKRVEAINNNLFQKINEFKALAEQLIVISFPSTELRDHWRKKFDIQTKGDWHE
jgi:hypothetical protein